MLSLRLYIYITYCIAIPLYIGIGLCKGVKDMGVYVINIRCKLPPPGLIFYNWSSCMPCNITSYIAKGSGQL